MSSIDPNIFVAQLEKHVGINDALYNLTQHGKAITDPKAYYAEYQKRLMDVKTQMAQYVADLLKDAKANQQSRGYTDDWVAQQVSSLAGKFVIVWSSLVINFCSRCNVQF